MEKTPTNPILNTGGVLNAAIYVRLFTGYATGPLKCDLRNPID